jgi:hypothetical protein
MSQLIFKPSTFLTQVYSVTATPICSAVSLLQVMDLELYLELAASSKPMKQFAPHGFILNIHILDE